MVHKPDVLLAVRSSRSNKDARCVSRARPPTCSIANLHSGRTQNPGRRQLDRVGLFSRRPFSVRNPHGQRSPHRPTIFSGTPARGRANAEAGQRVAEWHPRHRSTRRDQLTLKGKEPQPAASPRSPASRSSRHRHAGKRRRAGHAGAIADVRKEPWPTRTRTPATAHRQAEVHRADVEQRKRNLGECLRLNRPEPKPPTPKGRNRRPARSKPTGPRNSERFQPPNHARHAVNQMTPARVATR